MPIDTPRNRHYTSHPEMSDKAIGEKYARLGTSKGYGEEV
jgi:hypothetical protein